MHTSKLNPAWESGVQGAMGVTPEVPLPDSKGHRRPPGGGDPALSQSPGTSQEVPVKPDMPLLPVLPASHAPKSEEQGSSLTWLLPQASCSSQMGWPDYSSSRGGCGPPTSEKIFSTVSGYFLEGQEMFIILQGRVSYTENWLNAWALGGQIWTGVLFLICPGTAGKSPVSMRDLGNKTQR